MTRRTVAAGIALGFLSSAIAGILPTRATPSRGGGVIGFAGVTGRALARFSKSRRTALRFALAAVMEAGRGKHWRAEEYGYSDFDAAGLVDTQLINMKVVAAH